jgi:hypothetical protein
MEACGSWQSATLLITATADYLRESIFSHYGNELKGNQVENIEAAHNYF